MRETFDYQLFGLRIRSEIALPELFPAAGASKPDVMIRSGVLPRHSGPGLNRDDDALLLNIPEVGRYRIDKGREIIVDADVDVPERNVRLFLLGSALGALLHQRGMLPLHANAVEIDGSACAFIGESGAGKSTLAAWFHDRGLCVIADDVCVVGFDRAGHPYAAPGLPRLRLWAEALAASGRENKGLQRSYVEAAGDLDKFDVPISAPSSVSRDVPLAALYVLERASTFSIVRLEGIAAAEAVFAHTYRGSYLPLTKNQAAHWEATVRLVRTVPVFKASRKWDLAIMDRQCSQLLEHAAELIAGTRPGA